MEATNNTFDVRAVLGPLGCNKRTLNVIPHKQLLTQKVVNITASYWLRSIHCEPAALASNEMQQLSFVTHSL